MRGAENQNEKRQISQPLETHSLGEKELNKRVKIQRKYKEYSRILYLVPRESQKSYMPPDFRKGITLVSECGSMQIWCFGTGRDILEDEDFGSVQWTLVGLDFNTLKIIKFLSSGLPAWCNCMHFLIELRNWNIEVSSFSGSVLSWAMREPCTCSCWGPCLYRKALIDKKK